MNKLKRAPTHPGIILREDFMEPLGITQIELANKLALSPRTINEVVNEKRKVNPELAIKLSLFFNTSVELWLNLQNTLDVYNLLQTKRTDFLKIKNYLHQKATN
jgi:antitoxin HigA-1